MRRLFIFMLALTTALVLPAQTSRVSQPALTNRTFTVNGVQFTMVGVQGGTFQMGATLEQQEPYDDEKPVHQVTLSSYYIGQTEVTQALWKAVMGTSVSQQRDKVDKSWPLRGEGDNYPMYYVSWEECQEFISRLNEMLGSELDGREFRLPTEAEWEFAARGGRQSRGYQYSGSNNLDDVAWYWKNSGDRYLSGTDSDWDADKIYQNNCRTHPVATKRANELGLYDMSGNVWEWCYDYWDSYSSSAQTNPTGPGSGSYRVYRGGSWYGNARFCRTAIRSYDTPTFTYYYLGLRLAR